MTEPTCAGGRGYRRTADTIGTVTEIIPADDTALVRQRAAAQLTEGELIVAPTDTAYAVFADAFQMDATQRLLDARSQPRSRPLPVIVRSPRQLAGLVKEQTEQAERLVAAFWPGPLTLIFRANEGLAWDLGDMHGAVAVRMPDEPMLYELVAEVGPLAFTAASTMGAPAPTTVEGARDLLGDRVALYIDGGPRPGGRSTIVDVSRGGAEVLRAGAVSSDEVFAAATGAIDWGNPAEQETTDREEN